MIETNVIGNNSANVPPDQQDDTNNSRHVDEELTTEQKKRKFEQVYSGHRWQEEDKYEVQKVKQIVRNNIFKHVKFVKGEGYKNTNNDVGRKNGKGNTKEYGKCHEWADLTKVTGYEYNVMKLAGVTEMNCSISDRALYWKTYNEYVREEIRQMRGRMSGSVKQSVNQGEYRNQKTILIHYILYYNFAFRFIVRNSQGYRRKKVTIEFWCRRGKGE